jgi:hypothetical protein
MSCTGNDSFICGGPDRIQYYAWTGTPLNTWDFPTETNAGEYQFLIGGKYPESQSHITLAKIFRGHYPSDCNSRCEWEGSVSREGMFLNMLRNHMLMTLSVWD